jgi:hypothetical protein
MSTVDIRGQDGWGFTFGDGRAGSRLRGYWPDVQRTFYWLISTVDGRSSIIDARVEYQHCLREESHRKMRPFKNIGCIGLGAVRLHEGCLQINAFTDDRSAEICKLSFDPDGASLFRCREAFVISVDLIRTKNIPRSNSPKCTVRGSSDGGASLNWLQSICNRRHHANSILRPLRGF